MTTTTYRARPRRVQILKGDAPRLRSRVAGALGAALTQASFATISYQIFDMTNTAAPDTAIQTGTLTVSQVVFNTLQDQTIDPTWEEDTVGYNFSWQASADSFKPAAVGPSFYRVEIRATATAGGQPFWVGIWDIEIVDVLTTLGAGA